MSPRLLRGPLLLLLWQATAVGVQADSAGRYRLTVGVGAGQWEERSLGCSGEVLSADPLEYRYAGAQLDAWPSTNARLSLTAGALSYPDARTFPVVGGVVAAEWQRFGLGAGVMTAEWADDPSGILPSLYLRAGNRDRLHFRVDVYAPSATMPTTDVGRIGLGFNQGLLRGAAGFVGLGIGPFSDESHLGGPFGEVAIPLSRGLDLSASASWRPSAQYADWGLSLGGRHSFGR